MELHLATQMSVLNDESGVLNNMLVISGPPLDQEAWQAALPEELRPLAANWVCEPPPSQPSRNYQHATFPWVYSDAAHASGWSLSGCVRADWCVGGAKLDGQCGPGDGR